MQWVARCGEKGAKTGATRIGYAGLMLTETDMNKNLFVDSSRPQVRHEVAARLRVVGGIGILLCALGLTTTAMGQQDAPATPNMPAVVMPSEANPATLRGEAYGTAIKALTPEELLYTQHLITLANPFFEGRAPGTRGNVLAAEYVEFYLRQRVGLKPAFPTEEKIADGTSVSTPWSSFRQPFQRGTELKVTQQTLSGTGDGQQGELVFAAGTDFNPLGYSGSGEVSGQLVSVGYSINDGPDDFTSYPEGADLKDKIALIFRFEPLNAEGKSKLAEQGFSTAAALPLKMMAAINRGAKGVILVNPPGLADPRAGKLETVRSTQSTMLPQQVPIVMMSEAAADRLLTAYGSSLAAARSVADAGKQLLSFDKSMVKLNVKLERSPIMTDNVAGVLRGKGALADEYLIIGGHYDHLGYGYFGSRDRDPAGKIHVGADDNASGTSGVLLAAQKISDLYAALPADASARSIIFVTFSAEESGLNGARAFIRKSPVPAKQVMAMLNMDMIGRLRKDKVDIDGVGTAEEWNAILDPHVQRSGLVAKRGQSGRGPSDHAEFFGAGLPVLHFFTGLHPEYHTPADLYQTINTPGAVQVVGLLTDVAMDLAKREKSLTFKQTKARSLITMPSEDEKPTGKGVGPAAPETAPSPHGAAPAATPGAAAPEAPAASGPGGVSGVRVRFGIAPGDYSGEDGVLVGDVYPNTSAAEAGLKEGDLITKWNDTALKSVEDWMPLLSKHKPGDKVTVVYTRKGKQMEGTCTLKGREERKPD